MSAVRFFFLAALVLQPGRVSELEELGWEELRSGRAGEALSAFEAAIAVEPLRGSSHYGRGMAFAALVDYGSAVDAFERAAALDPAHGPALRKAAALHAQLGHRESARDALRRALPLGPAPAAERIALGRALRKAGLLEEARAVFGTELEATAEERLELGLLEMESENYAAAASHLEAAVRDPEKASAEAEYEYGRCLEFLERPRDAEVHYRLSLEREPNFHKARFRLGNLLLSLGEREEGIEKLRGYERYRKWDRRVGLLLAMVSSGTLAEAEKLGKTLELADLLLQGGALEDAERVVTTGLAAFPQEPLLRVALAKTLLLRKQHDRAWEELGQVLSLPSPPGEAFWLQGLLFLARGETGQALEAYRKAHSGTRDPPAQFLKEMAAIEALAGDFESAERDFERAIAKDPAQATARADLALFLESRGRLEEAAAQYRKALEIDPGLEAAIRGLAEVLEKTSKPRK